MKQAFRFLKLQEMQFAIMSFLSVHNGWDLETQIQAKHTVVTKTGVLEYSYFLLKTAIGKLSQCLSISF